jgi:hypothetical protein
MRPIRCELVPSPRPSLGPADREVVSSKIAEIVGRDGKVTPESFLSEAEPADSPLHRYFEWDDAAAAREHRLHQARQIVRSVVYRLVRRERAPREVTARTVLPEQRRIPPVPTCSPPHWPVPEVASSAPTGDLGAALSRVVEACGAIEGVALLGPEREALLEVAGHLAAKIPWVGARLLDDDEEVLRLLDDEPPPPDGWDDGRPACRGDCEARWPCPSCSRVVCARVGHAPDVLTCPLCGVELAYAEGKGGRRWVLRGTPGSILEPSELPMHVLNRCRPCWVAGCPHHLYLRVERDSGRIRLTHRGVPPESMGDLVHTCALDVADSSPGGVQLEVVGVALGLTRERIRQIELRTLEKCRKVSGRTGAISEDDAEGVGRDIPERFG